MDFFRQIPADKVQPSGPECLQDNPPVGHLRQGVKNLGVCAGNQLQQENIVAKAAV